MIGLAPGLVRALLSSRSVTLLLACLIASSPMLLAKPAGNWQFGLRLGLLSNSHNEVDESIADVRLFANKTNFYIEGQIHYYITTWGAAVLNLGSYSKGDIRFDVLNTITGSVESFIGTAAIVPAQFGVRLEPPVKGLPLKIGPYVEGGGSFTFGRETATLGPAYSLFSRVSDGTVGSETAFGWWVGSGGEIPLSERLQLDLTVKYLNSKFSGDIAGIKDFSGLIVAVGLEFLQARKR